MSRKVVPGESGRRTSAPVLFDLQIMWSSGVGVSLSKCPPRVLSICFFPPLGTTRSRDSPQLVKNNNNDYAAPRCVGPPGKHASNAEPVASADDGIATVEPTVTRWLE